MNCPEDENLYWNFKLGDLVSVIGKISLFRGARQIVVQTMRILLIYVSKVSFCQSFTFVYPIRLHFCLWQVVMFRTCSLPVVLLVCLLCQLVLQKSSNSKILPPPSRHNNWAVKDWSGFMWRIPNYNFQSSCMDMCYWCQLTQSLQFRFLNNQTEREENLNNEHIFWVDAMNTMKELKKASESNIKPSTQGRWRSASV